VSLVIQRAEFFAADFERQFAWYVDKAGAEVAWRFQEALDVSLQRISFRPDLGRLRHFRNPRLHDLRSFLVEPPFEKLLIFYRVEIQVLRAVRLMHGARDLPRRLMEPPVAAAD
jgi:plasmid stabilization system protein ParE